MSEIKISLITMDGIERQIETPSDIMANEFIAELVLALSLPYTDAEGNPISWRIDNKDTGKTLRNDQTLEQNGVINGHRLSLIRASVAGGSKLMDSSTAEDVTHFITADNILNNVISRASIRTGGEDLLLISRPVLSLLEEYAEENAISKWLNCFIGFFLGASFSLSALLLVDNTTSYFRGAFLGASLISVLALFILITIAHKINNIRRKEIAALMSDLSAVLKQVEKTSRRKSYTNSENQ